MNKSHYIIPIFVPHEGCPHNCVFCNQDSITGSTIKVDSSFVEKTILDYLKTINKKNSVIEVSFFGGTFTAIKKDKQIELLTVAKKYKEMGLINSIRLSTRPDYIDNEILDNLKKYSVDIIELGVQSLDDAVLIKSGRGHSKEDVIYASNLIKEYGFVLGHQIMVGLPGDSFEKDLFTANMIVKLKPAIVRIYPSLVIKNTPMEKMFLSGEYKPYTLDESIEVCKKIYSIFVVNNINIIRIGLQPTDEINVGKEIVAGPFHPSFRELIEGSIYKDMILDELLENPSDEFKIIINSKEISKLYAYRKKFFIDMKKHLKTSNVKVIQDGQLQRGTVKIIFDNTCNNLSIYEFLLKNHKEGNL